MTFDSHLADIRFGCGLAPGNAPPASVTEMMERLQGPDLMADTFPIPGWTDFQPRVLQGWTLERERRALLKSDPKGASQMYKRIQAFNREGRHDQMTWLASQVLRRAHAQDGFRERLVAFWADHFAVEGKVALYRWGASPFSEEALRPHLAGYFEDMLVAVARSPMMLLYLDQARSVGPSAPSAKADGLNENYARELMELHTLGVNGSYTQEDVRQMARLLTGLSQAQGAFLYREAYAEPGIKSVLGQDYGRPGPARYEDVEKMLRDLARHPETAAHLSRKLAVHFVSDSPSEALLDHMTERYLQSGGLLAEVYGAMLEHPDAWKEPLKGNVKRPLDFIGSTFRALALPEESLRFSKQSTIGRLNSLLVNPMAMMGQSWEHPVGPDGWPEEDVSWISAQRYAARLNWSMSAPLALLPELPDPRDLLRVALGPHVPKNLDFAVSAAETRSEGLTLILASPAFQRM